MAKAPQRESKGTIEDPEGEEEINVVKEVMNNPEAKAALMAEMKEELLTELREETW